MEKIKRISSIYRILFQLIFYCVPIGIAVYWMFFNELPHGWAIPAGVILPFHINISNMTKFLGFFISMIPTAVAMAGIHQLVKLFRLYERAIIFSEDNIRCFRNIGLLLFLWIISCLIYDAFITFLLTYNNPPWAYRTVTISFGASDLVAILVGFLILLISWVMKEAHQLEEEQKFVV